MTVIHLDASGWRKPEDFYAALLPALGAPAWHGRNLDALYDSLSGSINRVQPPIRVELHGVANARIQPADFVAKVAALFGDARRLRGAEVRLVLR
jgi:RNAse (barnase) inhibitor barstar